ncbi:MAG: hypothetical protein Q9163_005145, partial [Psora crenata]
MGQTDAQKLPYAPLVEDPSASATTATATATAAAATTSASSGGHRPNTPALVGGVVGGVVGGILIAAVVMIALFKRRRSRAQKERIAMQNDIKDYDLANVAPMYPPPQKHDIKPQEVPWDNYAPIGELASSSETKPLIHELPSPDPAHTNQNIRPDKPFGSPNLAVPSASTEVSPLVGYD